MGRYPDSPDDLEDGETMNIELAKDVHSWATAVRETIIRGEPRLNMDLYLGGAAEDIVPVAQLREGGCKTSACIAGYVSLVTAPVGTTVAHGDLLRFPDGGSIRVKDWAQEQLDITDEQADTLFYSEDETAPEILMGMIEEAMA